MQTEKRNGARRNPHTLGLQLPPPPSVLVAPSGVVTKPLAVWDQHVSHPGKGVEPQRVLTIYRSAEAGYPLEQCDLFDDIVENDGHLRALLESRTLAVAGKAWQIQAGGAAPADIRAAEILDAALHDTNFELLMMHMLGARYYGWAGAEIIWERRGSDIVPTWFVNVPSRRFRFDDRDRPMLINSAAVTTGEELTPGRWVFGRNGNAGLTARSGLLRTGTWYALFKRWSWRDWVIYGEKFGIPLVIGRYQEGASEEDKGELQNTVEDIGEAGQAIMSANAEVDIREAQRGGESNNLHRTIVVEANAELSKLITGSTLTVDSGGPGSFALGRVHETRAFDLVTADAAWLSNIVRSELSRAFLSLNGFPPGTRPPELVIHIARESDPLTRVQLAEKLQRMGLELDKEQLREEFQFRAPPTPDRALGAVSSEPSPEPSPEPPIEPMPDEPTTDEPMSEVDA